MTVYGPGESTGRSNPTSEQEVKIAFKLCLKQDLAFANIKAETILVLYKLQAPIQVCVGV